MEVMLRFTVISHKVTPTGFLTQSQAQSINKEVPGLMFFLHKAAGSQAQDMAHCAQKKEEIHFWPFWAGMRCTLLEGKIVSEG